MNAFVTLVCSQRRDRSAEGMIHDEIVEEEDEVVATRSSDIFEVCYLL